MSRVSYDTGSYFKDPDRPLWVACIRRDGAGPLSRISLGIQLYDFLLRGRR